MISKLMKCRQKSISASCNGIQSRLGNLPLQNDKIVNPNFKRKALLDCGKRNDDSALLAQFSHITLYALEDTGTYANPRPHFYSGIRAQRHSDRQTTSDLG
jgi:hypothetical protein